MNSKESIACHYWFFNHGFKLQDSECDVCHDLTILCLNLSNIATITVKNVDYRCIFYDIRKSEAIHLLKILRLMIVDIYKVHINTNNQTCNYFDNIIQSEKL